METQNISQTDIFLERENLRKDILKIYLDSNFTDFSLIRQFLKSSDEFVLELAIRKIGSFAIKSHFGLLEGFHNHIAPNVRAAVAFAFGIIRDRRAIDLLLKMHEDSTYFVRWECVIALANINMREGNPVFIKALKDKHSIIRMISARALGNNIDMDHVPILQKAAGDPVKPVKAAVIEALGKAGNHSSLAIISEATYDSDEEVRTVAILALCRYPRKKNLNFLRNTVNDRHDCVRMATIKALEQLGGQDSVKLISSLTGDKNHLIRQAVVKALGETGSFNQLNSLIASLKDPSSRVRSEAATALGKLGYTESANALVNAVKDGNASVRAAAASALCLINEQREISPNIGESHFNIYLDNLASGDILVREEAARNLAYTGVPVDIAPVVESAKDAYTEVRRLAIRALAYIRSKGSAGILFKALADNKLSVRWEAVYHMESYIDKVRINDLVKMYGDPDPSIRLKAAQLLALQKAPEGLEALYRSRRDRDIWVRRASVIAVTKYDSKEIIPFLKNMLSDQVLDIASIAAIKLLEMKVEDGIGVIIDSLRSDDPQKRYECARALRLLKTNVALRSCLRILKDKNEYQLIKREAMHYIARYADYSNFLEVKNLYVKAEDNFMKEKAIIALSNINHPDSIQTLREIFHHPPYQQYFQDCGGKGVA